jgi:hypothetical protein
MSKETTIMHTRKAVPYAVATVLVAGIAVSGSPGSAAEKSAAAAETLTIDNSGWSSEKSERLALNLGQLLVIRIEGAKQALDEGDVSSAQAAILDGESTAQTIADVSPVILVTDTITDAKNKVLAEEWTAFADALVPVNGYVDQMEVFAPKLAHATRQKMSAAKDKAAAKDTKGTAMIIQEIADDLTATTYYLPVRHAFDQLEAARLALAASPPDLAKAKTSIDSALDVVVVKVDSIETAAK